MDIAGREHEHQNCANQYINAAAYHPRVDLQPGDVEYKKLHRSIEEFGHVEPIVWNERTGHVVGGHQRLRERSMTGEGKILLKSKKNMKIRGFKSPDRADAYVLIFGENFDGTSSINHVSYNRKCTSKKIK